MMHERRRGGSTWLAGLGLVLIIVLLVWAIFAVARIYGLR